MSIRIRKKADGEILTLPSAAAVAEAVEAGTLSGRDEYHAPGDDAWVALDEHPTFSTTDARGVYPALVHFVAVVKILVFITFLAVLSGHAGNLSSPVAFYFYGVAVVDVAGIVLAYANRSRTAAAFFWLGGIASFPLGLFLIISARMIGSYRFRPAE